MSYKNTRNMALYLTELKREVKPYEVIELTEEELKTETVQHFFKEKILEEVTSVGNVVLPAGVSPTPEEFGTVISTGPKKMPGTAKTETLEEAITTESQKVQENMKEIGEDLKKNKNQ